MNTLLLVSAATLIACAGIVFFIMVARSAPRLPRRRLPTKSVASAFRRRLRCFEDRNRSS